jgi:hypothetical protein
MQSAEEGFDVSGVCAPLEKIADCHLGGELFGLDEAQCGLEVALLFGGLSAGLVLSLLHQLLSISNLIIFKRGG